MIIPLGNLKPSTEIIQWPAKGAEENINQQFGLTNEGHIYVLSKPTLMLGFKARIFGKREGAHVNLQLQGRKDKKEQRWNFIIPAIDADFVKPQTPETAANTEGTFPDEFPGLLLGVEGGSTVVGTKLTVDAMRPKGLQQPTLAIPELLANREPHAHQQDAGSGIGPRERYSTRETAPLSRILHSFHTPSPTLTILHLVSYRFHDTWPEHRFDWAIAAVGSDDLIEGSASDKQSTISVTETESDTIEESEAVTAVTDIRTVAVTTAEFPEGWFYIRLSGEYVLGVENASIEHGAKTSLHRLNKQQWESQLWSYHEGYLVNKRSSLYLTIEKGVLIQSHAKSDKDSATQQWALNAEGHIYSLSNKSYYLGAKETTFGDLDIFSVHDLEKQSFDIYTWSFLVPVFGKRAVSRGKILVGFPSPSVSTEETVTETDITIVDTETDITIVDTETDITIVDTETDITIVDTETDITIVDTETDITIVDTETDITIADTETDITIIDTESVVSVVERTVLEMLLIKSIKSQYLQRYKIAELNAIRRQHYSVDITINIFNITTQVSGVSGTSLTHDSITLKGPTKDVPKAMDAVEALLDSIDVQQVNVVYPATEDVLALRRFKSIEIRNNVVVQYSRKSATSDNITIRIVVSGEKSEVQETLERFAAVRFYLTTTS
ncbi:LOW QUALITY PROTEIN: hypothetical protein BC936DRAFT_144793 [Jimgerdemannia flammicorona]|uniref:Ricin B lectin domain-containing protein n=1 Tax=Jimgerdemannia flammicorona TaxID=994334 RepID=A0A433DBP6_9FUNG|nr:LOW QUALITY PROTEIN: hypothetical protein BC936DRAFT_144793 [Jimgerdemannia flammicorona]